MTYVPTAPGKLVESASAIGAYGSATALAAPVIMGANYLLGYRLGGLLHSQQSRVGASSGTGRFYTYRHYNSSGLVAVIKVKDTLKSTYIKLTAGSGTTETYSPLADGNTVIPFSWGASDSGWCEVTYEISNVTLLSISIFDRRLQSLTSSHYRAGERAEVRGGYAEGAFIISDDVLSVATAIKHERESYHRQIVSWCWPADYFKVIGSAWKQLTVDGDDYTFYGLGTPQYNGESSNTVRIYVYSQYDGGSTSYEWKAETSLGTATKTGLTNTSWAWSYVGSHSLKTGDDDTLKLSLRCSDSSGTAYVRALSVIAE